MEIQLRSEVESRLGQIAAERGQRADQYAADLIESHLDHDTWFRSEVRAGIDALDRGEYLSHEAVGARIESLFRS